MLIFGRTEGSVLATKETFKTEEEMDRLGMGVDAEVDKRKCA